MSKIFTVEKCICCNKETASVIETKSGYVCFLCYTNYHDHEIGQKAKRKIKHEEADIQSEFFKLIPTFFPGIPDKLLFAVPNGGSRDIREARNLKAQGVKSGVADVILLVPKKGFSCLCLEFKNSSGSQSNDQKEFERQITSANGKYVIVRSVSKAFEEIRAYLQK